MKKFESIDDARKFVNETFPKEDREKSSKVWIWVVIVVLLAILAGLGWLKAYRATQVKSELTELKKDLSKVKSDLAKANSKLAESQTALKACETVPSTPKAVIPVPKKKIQTFVAPIDPNSVVDELKRREMESDFCSRRDLYFQAGGKGTYKGSAKQNIFLLRFLKMQKKAEEEAPLHKVEEKAQPMEEVVSSNVPSRDLSKAGMAFMVGGRFEIREEATASIEGKVKEVATVSEFVTFNILGPVTLSKANESDAMKFTILGTVADISGSLDDKEFAKPEEPEVVIIGNVIPPSQRLEENTPEKGGG